MSPKAFQDYYLDNVAQCYGWERLNADGQQIKTFWEGMRDFTTGGKLFGALGLGHRPVRRCP
jgi:hypothetical protein